LQIIRASITITYLLPYFVGMMNDGDFGTISNINIVYEHRPSTKNKSFGDCGCCCCALLCLARLLNTSLAVAVAVANANLLRGGMH
jgi:hypothetical protein